MKATHLKEPITHPRGERHLQFQTKIIKNIVRHVVVIKNILPSKFLPIHHFVFGFWSKSITLQHCCTARHNRRRNKHHSFLNRN